MRQFDVCENPDENLRRFAPYLVVLQSHHLSALDSKIVAPLVRDARRALGLLDVQVTVGDEPLVLAVAELAAIPGHLLQRPVANLAAHEDAIRHALDRVFTGF